MKSKKIQNKICEHRILKHTGYWDSVNEGGPIVKCINCGKKFNFSWEKWKETPEKNKIELPHIEKIKKNCNHSRLELVDFWSGDKPQNGGPVVLCLICDKTIKFTWREWEKIPKENIRSFGPNIEGDIKRKYKHIE